MEGQENMEGNSYVMDTVADGPLLLGNKTHKVVNRVGDRVFNYFLLKTPSLNKVQIYNHLQK